MTLRSMTGYGRWRSDAPGEANAPLSQDWEIKSVNSRHLDCKWRLPQLARRLEPALEKTLRRHASRGRIEITLHLTVRDPSLLGMSLNRPMAAALLQELEAFAASRGHAFTPDYARLLSMPHLWEERRDGEEDALLAPLETGLGLALEAWNASRAAEGRILVEDMRARIRAVSGWGEELAVLIPAVSRQKMDTLRERLAQCLAGCQLGGAGLDEGRFLQEAAILADKVDVSEELTRLAAHLALLDDLLDQGGELGKRLDFTLQEAFREINTLGNKSQDVAVSRLAVSCKAELEKCREQVQNVE